eukprot:2560882-Pleurochrysis_carterae.AAC.1
MPQQQQQRHGVLGLRQAASSRQQSTDLHEQPQQSGTSVYSALVQQMHALKIVRSFSLTESAAILRKFCFFKRSLRAPMRVCLLSILDVSKAVCTEA